MFENCVYARRKQRATAEDLEEELAALEAKYARVARVKARSRLYPRANVGQASPHVSL